MSTVAARPAPARAPGLLWWIFTPEKTERDVAARPSDGLVVFSVMWAMALMLSAASRIQILRGDQGLLLAGLTWGAIGAAALVVMNPRKTRLLLLVTGLMLAQYILRLPVPSNNQTIGFFMNTAVFVALTAELWRTRGGKIDRDVPYEQLRVVARALLATMYFYGIFHKINTGFLDPEVSCATALYVPLAAPFGLGENLFGRYLAIYSTFVIEGIAIVCLYWRRFFWVGLLVSLPFHYVIPISGYSWYMDFSSLVFALYMLSVPRDVSSGLYSTGAWLVRRVPHLGAGMSAVVALALVWGLAGAAVLAAATFLYPGRALGLLWHSAWLIVWALFGGLSMLFIIRAALLEQPYQEQGPRKRQSWWVYAIPTVLFVTAFSPYVGLKTESSIAMFSNLHTEGGVSNHLLFPEPPYLFDYQTNVARVIDSNSKQLQAIAANPNLGLVEHDIAIRLVNNPGLWITYEMNGQRFEQVRAETFTGPRPNFVERKLLDFKPVDWARPKVCTH
jgi:hypothetical protein